MDIVLNSDAAILAQLEAKARFALRPHRRAAEKLEPLRRLLTRLGHPEREQRIVHIAGTNGKGTTAEMVARALQLSGARVGLYTSPHLLHIRERVRIDGEPVAEGDFARAARRVLAEQEAMPDGDGLSYFDLLTAIGFVLLRESGLEWTVLETGLGGTADSTNVAERKALCILTAVGHDHLSVLGPDLRSIARQKMGIARPGTPVVLARQDPELEPWMARELEAAGSPVLPPARVVIEERSGQGGRVRVTWPEGATDALELPCHLVTQPHVACAAAALTAAGALLPLAPGRRELAEAVLQTALPGRLQLAEGACLGSDREWTWPRVVLDGAHNRESLAALNGALAGWSIRPYTLLVTLMRDKLVDPVREPLRELLAGADHVLGVLLPYDRAPDAETLTRFLEALMPASSASGRVQALGLDEALREAARWREQPLVAAGSLWMIGDLLKRLRLNSGAPERPGTEESLSSRRFEEAVDRVAR
jgi:dihydrofolate synthase/folylpolyglutamate synthase